MVNATAGLCLLFFSSRRRHTRCSRDWSSDVCSSDLDQGLFAPADRLAIFLVEQRRYAEAEQVMLCVRERLSDPTPANGRLAWIHHQQGKKEEARNELASLLRAVPSYLWGWMVLHDALVADQAWDDARTIFISTPTELQTHMRFRRQRLVLLEKAGLSPAELDVGDGTA